MLKNYVSLFATGALLTACMTTEPPAPSPQRQQLINACENGNLDACKFLETADANMRAQQAAAWSDYQRQQAARPNPLDKYDPYAVLNAGRNQQTTTTCQNVLGRLVCQTN